MITIVSGLPRSGTSMMMQMLAAGGMPILTDNKRQPDEDNPRGYFEWEKITRLCAEPEIIAEAEGKAVKVISRLLGCLPQTHEYRIILMERPLDEVIASMEKMNRHRHPDDEVASREITTPRFRQALEAAHRESFYWLRTGVRRNGTCSGHFWLHCYFQDVIKHPRYIADWVAGAFEPSLDIEAMVAAVDPSLYRNRL